MYSTNFLIAVLKVTTINLAGIAIAFPGKANNDSKYKRLQRLHTSFPIDFSIISKFIAQFHPVKNRHWILTIDRTNWKPPKVDITILIPAIADKGTGYSLISIPVSKRGDSH
jgi:hypothetical protein